MGSAIGDLLPLAVGIAISPMPVVAAILMLLSPKARTTSLAFLAGWLVGVVITLIVFTLLSSILPRSDPNQARPIAGLIKIALGALLLLLALRRFRSRPGVAAEPAMPKWMSAIDTMTALRGLMLGFGLSALNPKNLLLGVAAGTVVGTATLPVGQEVVAIVVFTIIASSTVGVPIVAYLVAPRAMAGPLGSLREWLLRNNATVMAVVLLVLGVVLIGKGIGSF